MKIDNFISLRYIFSKKKFQFITFISWLSSIGIAIGVVALIIVASMFEGFQKIAEDQILGIDPHLRIYSNDKQILDFLENEESVKSFTKAYESKILISSRNKDASAVLLIQEKPLILKHLSNYTVRNLPNYDLLIGGTLADNLGVFSEDQVEIITPDNVFDSFSSFRPVQKTKIRISNSFYINPDKYNHYLVVASSKLLKDFNLRESDYNLIDVELMNPDEVETLQKLISYKFEVKSISWKESNQDQLAMAEFEQKAVFVILSLIVVIATFNLFASISMTVIEKKLDIGILKVLGAENETIKNVFLKIGLAIGSGGTLIGGLIGTVIVYTQDKYGWWKISVDNSFLTSIPVETNIFLIFMSILVGLALSYVASVIPSRLVLSKDSVNSLTADN